VTPALRTVVVDDEPLPRERIVTLVRQAPGLELVGEAATGTEALDRITALRPDLVFLDIQLPELDGFEVVEALGAEVAPHVVFVTAYDQHAVRAFEVDAVDYLLKPVQPERFAAAVARIRARVEQDAAAPSLPEARLRALLDRLGRTERRRFVVRRGSTHAFIDVDDVDWIDAQGNYVRLHVGTQAHLVRHTMKEVEAQLAASDFVRIHRSCIVRVSRIGTVEATGEGEYRVTMRDGTRLESSRGYAARIRELLR
jgi:two-component system LytT family response regulator